MAPTTKNAPARSGNSSGRYDPNPQSKKEAIMNQSTDHRNPAVNHRTPAEAAELQETKRQLAARIEEAGSTWPQPLVREELTKEIQDYFDGEVEAGRAVLDPATGEYLGVGPEPIDRPCPAWCELEHGHGWESTWGDYTRVSRFHVRYISPAGGQATVSVTSEETAVRTDCGHPKPTYERNENGSLNRIGCECPLGAEGHSEFSPLVVSTDVPDELDDEQALQVGDWLRQAAHRVRQCRADVEADEFIHALGYTLKGAGVGTEQVMEILGVDAANAERILFDLGAQSVDTLNDLVAAAGLRLSEVAASVEEQRGIAEDVAAYKEAWDA